MRDNGSIAMNQFDETEYRRQRTWMVDEQLVGRGISDPRVLAAMREVPRHLFVPEYLRSRAYEDSPLPIGQGQTISQPYTVAFMCQAVCAAPDDRILEVGTGCGYSAAVLARLCREVTTIERIEDLANEAAQRLAALGIANVTVMCGDGTRGVPDDELYDGIVVTAGAPSLPAPYVAQLAEGGRIVVPIGPQPSSQIMHRFTKRGGRLADENLGRFAFVPLIGALGWSDSG